MAVLSKPDREKFARLVNTIQLHGPDYLKPNPWIGTAAQEAGLLFWEARGECNLARKYPRNPYIEHWIFNKWQKHGVPGVVWRAVAGILNSCGTLTPTHAHTPSIPKTVSTAQTASNALLPTPSSASVKTSSATLPPSLHTIPLTSLPQANKASPPTESQFVALGSLHGVPSVYGRFHKPRTGPTPPDLSGRPPLPQPTYKSTVSVDSFNPPPSNQQQFGSGYTEVELELPNKTVDVRQPFSDHSIDGGKQGTGSGKDVQAFKSDTVEDVKQGYASGVEDGLQDRGVHDEMDVVTDAGSAAGREDPTRHDRHVVDIDDAANASDEASEDESQDVRGRHRTKRPASTSSNAHSDSEKSLSPLRRLRPRAKRPRPSSPDAFTNSAHPSDDEDMLLEATQAAKTQRQEAQAVDAEVEANETSNVGGQDSEAGGSGEKVGSTVNGASKFRYAVRLIHSELRFQPTIGVDKHGHKYNNAHLALPLTPAQVLKLPAEWQRFVDASGYIDRQKLLQGEAGVLIGCPMGCKMRFTSYATASDHLFVDGGPSYLGVHLRSKSMCPNIHFQTGCLFAATADSCPLQGLDQRDPGFVSEDIANAAIAESVAHQHRHDIGLVCRCGLLFPTPYHAAAHLSAGLCQDRPLTHLEYAVFVNGGRTPGLTSFPVSWKHDPRNRKNTDNPQLDQILPRIFSYAEIRGTITPPSGSFDLAFPKHLLPKSSPSEATVEKKAQPANILLPLEDKRRAEYHLRVKDPYTLEKSPLRLCYAIASTQRKAQKTNIRSTLPGLWISQYGPPDDGPAVVFVDRRSQGGAMSPRALPNFMAIAKGFHAASNMKASILRIPMACPSFRSLTLPGQYGTQVLTGAAYPFLSYQPIRPVTPITSAAADYLSTRPPARRAMILNGDSWTTSLTFLASFCMSLDFDIYIRLGRGQLKNISDDATWAEFAAVYGSTSPPSWYRGRQEYDKQTFVWFCVSASDMVKAILFDQHDLCTRLICCYLLAKQDWKDSTTEGRSKGTEESSARLILHKEVNGPLTDRLRELARARGIADK